MSDMDEWRRVGDELQKAALIGSKTGRPDYARMVTAEELLRWHQAYAALLAQGQAPPAAESGAAANEVGPGYYDSHLLTIKPQRLGLTDAANLRDSGTSAGQGQAPPQGVTANVLQLIQEARNALAEARSADLGTGALQSIAVAHNALNAALSAGAAPTPPGVTVPVESVTMLRELSRVLLEADGAFTVKGQLYVLGEKGGAAMRALAAALEAGKGDKPGG